MLGSDTLIGTEIRLLSFKFIFQNKLMKFFYINQKLSDDNFFFLFQVELNFLIKSCLILRFKISLKTFWQFLNFFYLL
jgi:hypothetical protein